MYNVSKYDLRCIIEIFMDTLFINATRGYDMKSNNPHVLLGKQILVYHSAQDIVSNITDAFWLIHSCFSDKPN